VPLASLISRIHSGISTVLLQKEDNIQKVQSQVQSLEEQEEKKQTDFEQAIEHIRHLETNQNETSTQVQSMTAQIDQREYKIEKLEQKILEH